MNQLWLVFAVLASASEAKKPFEIQFVGQVAGKTVTICLDGRKVKKTFAGKLAMRDARHQFASVCADVRTPVATGQVFGVRMVSSDSANKNLARAGRIVSKHFADAKTPEQCAGLQLAVWEALEDGGEKPGYLNGRFQAQADDKVMLYAMQYYDAIGPSKPAVLLGSTTGRAQSQLTAPTVAPSKDSGTKDG